jgi:putative glutamine amidotransferase
MARPRIFICGPDRGGYAAWFFASWAVRFSGGAPLRVTPRRGVPSYPVDGLVLGGGADVHPSRYAPHEHAPSLSGELAGRTARSKLRTLIGYALAPLVYLLRRILSTPRRGLDPARDELEAQLLAEAFQSGTPVLGICRGAQLMNVQLGGTLHRGLEPFYVEQPNPWTVLPRKRVRITTGSRLAEILGSTTARVNSLHRQAVDRVGGELRVVASEPNGVVQALEHPGERFFIGVQWHPEYLPQRPEQRRLFRQLVRAAAEHRAVCADATSSNGVAA